MSGRALTREELSQLLYLESCATERGGMIEGARMNDADFHTVKHWSIEGFVQFGRPPSEPTGGPWVRQWSGGAWWISGVREIAIHHRATNGASLPGSTHALQRHTIAVMPAGEPGGRDEADAALLGSAWAMLQVLRGVERVLRADPRHALLHGTVAQVIEAAYPAGMKPGVEH